jgi:hypothetical protein
MAGGDPSAGAWLEGRKPVESGGAGSEPGSWRSTLGSVCSGKLKSSSPGADANDIGAAGAGSTPAGEAYPVASLVNNEASTGCC